MGRKFGNDFKIVLVEGCYCKYPLLNMTTGNLHLKIFLFTYMPKKLKESNGSEATVCKIDVEYMNMTIILHVVYKL